MSVDRTFSVLVVLPDHTIAVCEYPRAELVAKSSVLVPHVADDDIEATIERSVDRMDTIARTYMHYGDAEAAVADMAAMAYHYLSHELPDARFDALDHSIIHYDHVAQEMSAEAFDTEQEWDRGVENKMIDCEVHEQLGFDIPKPKYRQAEPVTLH